MNESVHLAILIQTFAEKTTELLDWRQPLLNLNTDDVRNKFSCMRRTNSNFCAGASNVDGGKQYWTAFSGNTQFQLAYVVMNSLIGRLFAILQGKACRI